MRKFHEQAGQVVFTFGRFNPPTTGHEKLLDKVKQIAGSSRYVVYPSQSQNQKKDPLPFALKVAYMRKMFPKHARNIIADKNIRNVFEGRFSGSDEYEFIFTIPATYGSSGSGVINENGEIISIITKASVDFKNITFGPTIDQLHHFLERLEE